MAAQDYDKPYCLCDLGYGCDLHPRELTPKEKANHEKWQKIWAKRREKELG